MAIKTISQVLFDYTEAKEDVKIAAQTVTKKAIENGCDPESAKDTRVAYAYLVGITRGDKR